MKTIGKDRFLRAGVLLLVMSALALAGETPKPSGLGNSASAPGPAEEAKPEAVLEPSLAAVMVHAQKTVLSPGAKKLLVLDYYRARVVDIPTGQIRVVKLPGSWAQGQPYIDDDGKITYVSHMGLIDGQDKGLPRMAGIAFFNHGAMFAAGTVTGQLIEVQTASGKIVKQLPVGFQSPMVFPTPDGKSVLARGYPHRSSNRRCRARRP